MQYAHEIFGASGHDLARADHIDAQTPAHRTFATTDVGDEPPRNPVQAITDPRGSAIFWIAAAAILGLILVTGEVRLAAAVGKGSR